MVRILLHGCCGRMGRIITDLASRDEDVTIIAGIDAFGETDSFPVYRTFDEYIANAAEENKADVIVDFSTAAAMDSLFAGVEKTGLPCVLCTTGLSEEQTQKMHELSAQAAILKSSNMSLGINVLEAVLKEVSGKLAAAGFDVEIVEKHHNKKLDAPSGTAVSLADAAKEGIGKDYAYVYGRSDRREKRPVEEIGISSVRGGTIVGDHDVIFAGEDEVITFSHRAYSRAIFGKGALEAAKFLAGRKPGMYSMSDVLA